MIEGLDGLLRGVLDGYRGGDDVDNNVIIDGRYPATPPTGSSAVRTPSGRIVRQRQRHQYGDPEQWIECADPERNGRERTVRGPGIVKHTPLALFVLAGLLAISPAQAGKIDLRGPQGASYSFKLTSLKEARFKTTVRQQYDFSCGSAATATLLTYQYGHPVTEAEVFSTMFANGSQDPQRGFSVDMRRLRRRDSQPILSCLDKL
jgi:hypothetical protein